MSKRFIITLVFLFIVALLGAVAIFLAKGYTFSTDEKRIVGTGIINVTSIPDAASVYIDGHLTTATDATIGSLPPKTYTVRVVKENFIPWEKQIEVKEGVVAAVKVTLFPSIPTIYPLTYTGVVNPTLSADGAKLAYIVPKTNPKGEVNRRAGVWVWTMVNNQPIAFARSAEPHQVAESDLIDFSSANLKWSPDSKQVIATIGNNNYLLNTDTLNPEPRDITPTLDSTLETWQEDDEEKNVARIAAIKNTQIRKVASESAFLAWAPDETKFMVIKSSDISHQSSDKTKSLKAGTSGTLVSEARLKTDSSAKVYDLEKRKEYQLPEAKAHMWLPDSEHVILVDEGTISVADFDGTNKAVIYAGKFEDSLVFPWPDSSRLVFITSFPTPTASEPNLYGVNLK